MRTIQACVLAFCLLAFSYSVSGQQDMVLHYPFNEFSTNVIMDASGSGNDGLVYGAKWTSKDSRAGVYECGGKDEGGGVDEYLETSASSAFGTTGQLSAAVWVYMRKNWSIFISNFHGGITYRGHFSFECTRDGYTLVTMGQASGVGVLYRSSQTNLISSNAWHHVAFSYDEARGAGNKIKIYIDGQDIGSYVAQSEGNGTSVLDTSERLRIMSDRSLLKSDGYIDDVMIFKRALSAAEIASLYNADTPPDPLRTVFAEPISLYGGSGAGLAVDQSDNLYVAENRSGSLGVLKINPEGVRTSCVPAGILAGVTAVAVDAGGNLYVADGNGNGNPGTGSNNKIWRVLTNGVVESFITGVRNPSGMAFDSIGNLYVASFADNAVYKYSGAGVPLGIVASGFDGLPYGLAIDREDNVYVAAFAGSINSNCNGRTIYKITKYGGWGPFFTGAFSDPHSLAFDKCGNLWASYYNGGKLVKIEPNGAATVIPGGWTADDHPNGIAFDSKGSLFVAVNGGFTTTNAAILKILNVGHTACVFASTSSGPMQGGTIVTICGNNLGSGNDITNVTLCGISASIISQSPTQVVVMAGSASFTTNGSVILYSVSRGIITAGNGYTYNPAGVIYSDNLSWRAVSSLPVARGLMGAAAVDGRIYAMGGYDYSWNSAAYSWNPGVATQGWTDATALPVGRAGLACVSIGGKIYSMGGLNTSGLQSAVYVYDPLQAGLGWVSLSNMPMPLWRLAAAVVNDKIYVLGGGSTNGSQSAVYEYDPLQPAQGWRHFNDLPATRENLAAVALDGKLYAIGGSNPEGFHANVYVCDPSHPEAGWISISSLPAARYVLTAATLKGKLFAVAGFNASQTGVNTVYMYDPVQPAQGWLSVSNLPVAKGEAPSVVVNGKIYVISGAGAPLSYQSSVYEGSYAVGVNPSAGSYNGGTTVTISGLNLGNGSDITNVTLCGVAASIVSQSATQVVVTSGVSADIGKGTVAVYSASFGLSSKVDAYSYTAVVFSVSASAGPNGSIFPAGVINLIEGRGTNFTVQAAPGHHIAEVIVDGLPLGSFGPASNHYSYAISGIAANHSIHAIFNTPPVIGVTASPTNGVAPARVLFDFSTSSDTETNIVRCEVDKEGDGLYETACAGIGRIIVEYGKPGQYLAAVRVIDACGADSTSAIPITVWGVAPSASLQASATSGPAPLALTLFGTNSAAAENHQIVAFEWDFDGDGAYDRLSRTGAMPYVYRDAGVYVAGLRVTDGQGLQDKATVTITVTPPVLVPPTLGLEATPASGKIPLPVSFVATVTNGAAIREYLWDFDGDGSVDLRTAGNTTLHTYGDVGSYQASVKVVDTNGLSGTASTTVMAQEPSAVRVWIVQPKDGDTVSGNAVTVNANAVPVSQVASVQIQYRQTNGAWFDIGAPMTPPPADFKTRWCVTNIANGTACELRAIAVDAGNSILTSEVVTVTVDAAGDSEGEDASGRHTKQANFSKDETAEVEVFDGTGVVVPLGAVESNLTVEIEITGVNTNPVNGSADRQASIHANRKVSLAGNPELGRPVTIVLPYADTNDDGLVDGTALPEATLTAHWFDTADGKWKKTLSCEVDTSANHVKVTTYHLTEFGLYANQNLLSPASGGMLFSCTYEGTNANSAVSLTDGNIVSYWKSPEPPLVAQEFVYGFTNYQGAICSEAVLYNGGDGLTNSSRDYEILVSMDNSAFTSVATGTLAMSKAPVAIDMGSVTCRVVKLVLSGGYSSNAWELAEFEVHGALTADPDGDGMSDAWEMRWFGAVGLAGATDYESDGLTDLAEYNYGSNPTTNDTDGDRMADAWEVQYGLQLTVADGTGDADGDGLSNLGEFIAGTVPTNAASNFRLVEPARIGIWQETASYDEGSGWTTGMFLRVEGFVFSWSTISGRVYTMNTSTNLMDSWNYGSSQYLGTGADITVTNWSTNTSHRFFRLQVDLP